MKPILYARSLCRGLPPARQRGFSLFIGLIMLVLMTLLAIAAYRVGSSQTVIVANAQHRNEGVDAAQEAIDIVLNSSNFTKNPAAAIPSSNCSGGGADTWCVDSTGAGVTDFIVTLSPQPVCIAAVPIPINQLNLLLPNDLACTAGTQQTFGVSGASTGVSLCANSTWEVSAQAADSATGTNVNVVQGVGVRIPVTSMTNFCP